MGSDVTTLTLSIYKGLDREIQSLCKSHTQSGNIQLIVDGVVWVSGEIIARSAGESSRGVWGSEVSLDAAVTPFIDKNPYEQVPFKAKEVGYE